MTRFGKLEEDGTITFAPREFVENGMKTIGFTKEYLAGKGYKPISLVTNKALSTTTTEVVVPEIIYVPKYTETDTEIVQEWVAVYSATGEPVTEESTDDPAV